MMKSHSPVATESKKDRRDQESVQSSTISSLQCYSVLSTIAQVLRKMSLKILASCFLMPYLSQTFESYMRVRIYTYSVNDLG